MFGILVEHQLRKTLSRLAFTFLLIPIILLFYACTPTITDDKQSTTRDGVLVEGFENASDWTVLSDGIASCSADTDNHQEGTQGLKMHVEGITAGFDKDGTFDFSRGSNIFFYLYVDEISNFQGLDIYLVVTPWSKYKRYILHTMFSAAPGWNRILLSKDSFITEGEATWDDTFTKIRLRCSPISGQTVNVTIDALRTDYQAQPVCIITFDDARSGVYESAFPILEGNDQKAVTFVVTDMVDAPTYMTKTQLNELQNAGWDISNHTKSHKSLVTLNASDLDDEVNGGHQWLIDNGFEKGASFFAYPGGDWDDKVVSKVKENHKLARCSLPARFQPHPSGLGDENYLITTRHIADDVSVEVAKDYINDTINQKGLLVLLFHDIVEEDAGKYQYQTADFQEISDYLKTRENEISVMTFSTYTDWLNSYTDIEISR